MILEITHYQSKDVILHQEFNEYSLHSQAIEHVMKYIIKAIINDVERIDLGESIGYALRRNGELITLLYK